MFETQAPTSRLRRRVLLAAPALLLGAAPGRLLAALPLTPPQSEGPFYPRSLPEDSDADLTVLDGRRTDGEVIEMVGRMFTIRGEPAAGGVVEIWHCDAGGAYAHVGQRTQPDFQGYGAVRADADGAYRFRTIRPGLYPGRTRHIHVKARRDGGPVLTTQMYFPGEAGNDLDPLLRRARDPAALVAREEPGPPPRYVFDIVAA